MAPLWRFLGEMWPKFSFVFWSFITWSNTSRSFKMIAWIHLYGTKLFVCLYDVSFKTIWEFQNVNYTLSTSISHTTTLVHFLRIFSDTDTLSTHPDRLIFIFGDRAKKPYGPSSFSNNFSEPHYIENLPLFTLSENGYQLSQIWVWSPMYSISYHICMKNRFLSKYLDQLNRGCCTNLTRASYSKIFYYTLVAWTENFMQHDVTW